MSQTNETPVPEATPAPAPERKTLPKVIELMDQFRELADEVESIQEQKECVNEVQKAVRYFRDRVRTHKTDAKKRAYQREYYQKRKANGKCLTETGEAKKPGRKPARIIEE
jgi:hypothetical protein